MKGWARLVALGVLGVPLVGAAQPGAKVPRVGVLCAVACRGPNVEAFRKGLAEAGYVEERSIALEYREAQGRSERLPELAAELVRSKVDVLVTDGTAVTRAAIRATKTVPIVMGTVGDPVASGFVQSLARPGGNVTGLSIMTVELNAKRLELLREVVPGRPRVAVLANPGDPAMAERLREMEDAARVLGLSLRVVEARTAADLDGAFGAMARDRAGALMVMPDVMLYTERRRIVELAAKARLPGIYEARAFAEAGGLMAYGPDIPANFRRAAAFVDKILRGVKPADIPVEQPIKFDLALNARTAKTLGLTFPDTLLVRADHVIQ